MGLSRNLACISPRVPSRRIQFVVKTKVFFACRFRFPASPMCKLVWNLKRMALEDDMYVAFHFTKKSTGTFPAMRCGCQGEVAGGCQSQSQRQEQQGLDSAVCRGAFCKGRSSPELSSLSFAKLVPCVLLATSTLDGFTALPD